MFETLKKLMGVSKPAETVIAEEAAAKEKIKNAEKVNTVTVKPKKDAADKTKSETRKSLGTLTKLRIDELAAERFGIQLDRRKTKTVLIDEFIAAQKKAK